MVFPFVTHQKNISGKPSIPFLCLESNLLFPYSIISSTSSSANLLNQNTSQPGDRLPFGRLNLQPVISNVDTNGSQTHVVLATPNHHLNRPLDDLNHSQPLDLIHQTTSNTHVQNSIFKDSFLESLDPSSTSQPLDITINYMIDLYLTSSSPKTSSSLPVTSPSPKNPIPDLTDMNKIQIET